MNIAIRVDASIDIGSGHVMRCLTLAEQFRENGDTVKFICRKTQGSMESVIRKQGFHVDLLIEQQSDIWNWMKNNYESDAIETAKILDGKRLDLLIIDHYGIDEKWENQFQNYKLMVIDDLANRAHNCDILLDQNFYKNANTRYKKYISNKTITCLGPKYMLIRKEFYLEYEKNPETTIFVFFGSMDKTNETLKTLKALKKLQQSYNFGVIVVVGNSNPHKENIKNYCMNMDSCEFYCQVNNMAELMAKCHFSITSGGTITWERSMVELPGLIIVVADNQLELANNLVEINACGLLGETENVTEKDILKAVEYLLNDRTVLEEWLINLNKIVDKNKLMNNPILEKINEVLNIC